MKLTIHVLVAFICGQVLQLGLQALGNYLLGGRAFLLCAITGGLTAFALCLGVILAAMEQRAAAAPIKEIFVDADTVD